ncbi:MAG: hypothetical protein AAF770_02735 [Bacteroidota bacterium]
MYKFSKAAFLSLLFLLSDCYYPAIEARKKLPKLDKKAQVSNKKKGRNTRIIALLLVFSSLMTACRELMMYHNRQSIQNSQPKLLLASELASTAHVPALSFTLDSEISGMKKSDLQQSAQAIHQQKTTRILGGDSDPVGHLLSSKTEREQLPAFIETKNHELQDHLKLSSAKDVYPQQPLVIDDNCQDDLQHTTAQKLQEQDSTIADKIIDESIAQSKEGQNTQLPISQNNQEDQENQLSLDQAKSPSSFLLYQDNGTSGEEESLTYEQVVYDESFFPRNEEEEVKFAKILAEGPKKKTNKWFNHFFK